MAIGSSTIGRVSVSGRGVDRLTARLRIERALASVRMEPGSLPPPALLCVRRLADPLPGALELDPDPAPSRVWERALTAQLERALSRAARPAREAVPASADAVLFADQSELLACLARDTRDGLLHTHWWWRGVGRGEEATGSHGAAASGDAMITAWLAAPEHVPAAIELLAGAGEMLPLLASLPAFAAFELSGRIAKAFGLAEVRTALTATSAGSASMLVEPADPPWRGVVPEAEHAGLPPEHELLIGLSLALRRAPERVRSVAFADQLRSWRRTSGDGRAAPVTPLGAAAGAEASEERIEAEPASPARTPWASAPSITRRRPAGFGPAEHEAPPLPSPASSSEATEAESRSADERGAGSPRRDLARRPDAPRGRPSRRSVRAPARSLVRAPASGGSVGRDHEIGSRTPPPEAITPLPELGMLVHTELGGAFYLLNVALFLNLYGDFSRPGEPGLRLSPWDLIALLTLELLGRETRADPLWGLLARLAGRRRGEPPGRGFTPPRAWRVPLDWLVPFGPVSDWRWSAAQGTLRVVDPAGFAVVAVPRTGAAPEDQLARELRRLGPRIPNPRRASLRREPVTPMRRWSSRLAAYVEARLGRALGVEPAESPGRVLICHPARVHVSASQVDVILSLDELPVAIRLAGLDRNPGWVPAAGRFLELHYR